MPVVPTVQGRQVQSQGVSTGGFSAQPSSDIYGAMADIGEKYIGAFGEAKQRANVAMAQDASLQLSQRAGILMNDPQKGLLNLQGKNAIGKGMEYTSQFDQAAEEIGATLPDDAARQSFMQQAQQQRIQFTTQAGRHELSQVNAYEEGQFQATLTNTAQTAASLYGDNAAYVSANKQTFDQIEQYGFAHGWSDEQIQAKKVEFKEKVADNALSNWSNQNSIEFIQSNGELSDTVSGSRRASVGGASGGARGIDNNNPGNLEFSRSNPWEGQTGSDGRFAKFETPEHGLRALGRNLISYQRQGYDTINEIINRWAPPEDDNDTASYIAAVSKQVGIAPDVPLDVSNPDTLKKLTAAIINHENGSQPFGDQQLNTGASAALGLLSLPTSQKRLTGNAAFDAASPQAQSSFLRQADQIRKQQQAEYRTNIDGKVRDATAAYMRGVEFPDAPQQQDFVAAYGFREGNSRYTELKNAQIAGQYIGSFRTMPTSSIETYVQQLKPDTGETGEGYAERAQMYDHVVTAATKVINDRENNPFNAAVDIGAYKPISSNNPQAISAEVANRFSSQENLRTLGIKAPILSSEEASALTQQIRGTTNVDQTIGLLQSMGQALPPQAMRMVASSIAPNSAATAYSALLLGAPDNQYDNKSGTIAYSQFVGYKPTMNKYDVSKTILAGDQLINPTKAMKDAGIQPVALPSEDKLKRAFTDQVGNAFSNNPQAGQLSYSLFKSAYAGIAYQSGDAAMTRTDAANSDVVEKAAQMATGGVYKGFNGGDVVMPFGMDKSTFKDRYTESAQAALKEVGLNPNSQSNFTPVNIGSNQYRMVSGSGRWATDPKTGQPIVVRVAQ